MNRSIVWILAAAVLSSTPDAIAAAPTYQQLLASLTAGDTEIDFTALRNAYVHSATYDPYALRVQGLVNRMYRADACAKSVRYARRIEARDFLQIDAHLILGYCGPVLHIDRGRSEYQLAVARGLFVSIMHSEDGLTPKSALKVVSTDEETAVLRLFGDRLIVQALEHRKGHWYDVDTVTSASDTRKSRIYFNIDTPYQALARQMRGSGAASGKTR